jgi:hypothetical protein
MNQSSSSHPQPKSSALNTTKAAFIYSINTFNCRLNFIHLLVPSPLVIKPHSLEVPLIEQVYSLSISYHLNNIGFSHILFSEEYLNSIKISLNFDYLIYIHRVIS